MCAYLEGLLEAKSSGATTRNLKAQEDKNSALKTIVHVVCNESKMS